MGEILRVTGEKNKNKTGEKNKKTAEKTGVDLRLADTAAVVAAVRSVTALL